MANCLVAQIAADHDQKIDFAEDRARVHGGDGIADSVEIGTHASGDDWNREGFTDLQGGVAFGV